MTKRFALLTSVLVALALSLSGCGGSSVSKEPADQRLTAAKKAFDTTKGVEITIKSKLPKSVSGLLAAEGIGTHQPAFDGKITVFQSNIPLTLPVIAVDNHVYVDFGKWLDVEPGQYNAPDPATLMNPSGGLSTLLTAATDVSAGKEQREGKTRVTSFTGKVSGEVISKIIPTAATKKSFDATFTLDDMNQLVKAVLTGPFYPKVSDVTYTLTFSSYGTGKTIAKPQTLKLS